MKPTLASVASAAGWVLLATFIGESKLFSSEFWDILGGGMLLYLSGRLLGAHKVFHHE